VPGASQVTSLLIDLEAGDRTAFEALVELLYDDLRRMARRSLRWQGDQLTLDTSGLVHEAFLRLTDQTRLAWDDRGHFLAVYATVMHRVLVDMARRRHAAKRGGEQRRITLNESHLQIAAQADELLALDEALARLADLSPRLVQVVECRFFAGLTEQDTALALQVTERTVRRDWVKARTLLRRFLETDPAQAPS
jgi:RNA polymerase sigma-70 factor, ECF subfamily